MTDAEKLALAEKIRSSNFHEPQFDYRYLAHMDNVDRTEHYVATCQGLCHVYLHTAKYLKQKAPVFVNIHGGGFVRPHMPCNTYFSARIADDLQCVVVDIDYKLAPEYPFPAAFDQCYDVVRWAAGEAAGWGCDPEKLIVCGHSAGANLTLSICIRAKLRGEQMPRLQILDFGAFDMVTDPADKPEANTSVMSMERLRAFNSFYSNDDPAVLYSPYVSAKFAPDDLLIGLPETLIITADHDNLRFEAEELGFRMATQEVDVTMKRCADSNHGFVVHCTGNWQEAQKLILHASMCC